jgi:hypothetical protein
MYMSREHRDLTGRVTHGRRRSHSAPGTGDAGENGDLRFRDHGFSHGDIARLRALADPARIREPERAITPSGSGHDGARPEDYYFPG